MEPSVHSYLDGDLRRDTLSPAAQQELAAMEATVQSVAAPLKQLEAPDLAPGVMARIAHLRNEASLPERVLAAMRLGLQWFWVRHALTIQLRPVYAMAALAFVLLAAVQSSLWKPRDVASAYTAPDTSSRVYVQFRLETSGASQVALAGSFTKWQPSYQLRETTPGTWSILLPLAPGIHDYVFVIDGEQWLADPHALQVDDGFGSHNSRIALPSPSERARSI